MTAALDKTGRFQWTKARIRAAILLAEDAKSDAEIAEDVGVARSTLSTWKTHPEFMARKAEHVAEFEASISRYKIAKRRERVRVLDEQQTKLLQVQDERGAEYAGMAPGAGTGTQVRQLKVVGSGQSQQVIEEWVTDTGLQSELRALQKQAAQELGQWSEKATVNHTGGIRREYVLVTEGMGAVDVADADAFADIEAEVAALFDEAPAEDGA